MGGKDKALLPFAEGRSFLQEILRHCQGSVMLSISPGQNIPSEGHSLICDEISDIGPLGGLYSALRCSGAEALQVFPCDMPHLAEGFFDYMASQSLGHSQAIVPILEGRIYPLCGIYHKSVLPILESQIQKGDYKALSLLDKIKVKTIDLNYTVFKSRMFNVNTPQEYRLARRQNPPRIIISGGKNTGKTTLIVKLIREFGARGLSCSVLKHTAHDYSFDTEGTDTFLCKQAGAESVLIYSPQKYMMVQNSPGASAERFLPLLSGCDIVLMEGFKQDKGLKIELVQGSSQCDASTVLAYAGSLAHGPGAIPIFSRDDVPAIASLILEHIYL